MMIKFWTIVPRVFLKSRWAPHAVGEGWGGIGRGRGLGRSGWGRRLLLVWVEACLMHGDGEDEIMIESCPAFGLDVQ